MNLNKKVVESMTVASALLVMSTITALGGSAQNSKSNVTENVALGKNGTAGWVADMYEMESWSLATTDLTVASIENVRKNIVSKGNQESVQTAASANGAAGLTEYAAEVARQSMEAVDGAAVETTTDAGAAVAAADQADSIIEASETSGTIQAETPEASDIMLAEAPEIADNTLAEASEATDETLIEAPEAAEDVNAEAPEQAEDATEWENLVMANVEEDMNIRTAPNAEAELAGKFYRGDVAEVVSVEGEWTQITSGNVTGYVKNEYLVYGNDANELANEVCSLYATVNADALRLRSEPSEEADVMTTAANGDRLKVNKDAQEVDGWVAVHTSDATAYVSEDYVEVELNLGFALSSEEVAAKEAAAREAEEKAAASAKKPASSASTDEVTLLGALIQCEAGGTSYEGMVAVGAVVMNRVRSGGYPGSISGVIYQAGQFTPALNGGVASVLASGVRSSCLQAARDAINGTDNTNGALSFRSASSGASGTVIGANVFF